MTNKLQPGDRVEVLNYWNDLGIGKGDRGTILEQDGEAKVIILLDNDSPELDWTFTFHKSLLKRILE